MGKCTVPKLFGLKGWFDARYDAACRKHDAGYKTLNILEKFWADVVILAYFAIDTLLTVTCFVAALIVLPTLGTIYWAWKRGREIAKGEWNIWKR